MKAKLIDSAPKDGRYILVWNGNWGVAYWNGESWDDGDFRDHIMGITHWHELPSDPEQ